MKNNIFDTYSQSILDTCDLIKEDISSTGMVPPDHLEFGKIIRFSDDGENNKNGWCIAFQNSNGSVAVSFGNWKDIQEKRFYNHNDTSMTSKDRNAFSMQIQEAMEKASQEKKLRQKEAGIKAKGLWDKAQPPNSNHEYLDKKQIKAYGIKQSGKALLIPVLDNQGEICSLQQILPDGIKKFMPGGETKGGSFVIGNIQDEDLFYICEGFATGATLHEVTGKPIVIAFNSGNLKRIAEAYNAKYSSKTIIIAADNDILTEKKIKKNPGRKAAEEAARAISAEVCLCPVNSDFNDLRVDKGIITVRQALKKTHNIELIKSEPLLLEREIEKAESYPLRALGEILSNSARVMNEGIQAPDALCAHAVLGFATHTVQGHANIIIDGRIIPLNEFFLSIGSRSARKSECDSKAGHVHKTVQKKLLSQHQTNRTVFKDEQEVYKEEKKKIFSDKKKTLSEKNEILAELRKNEPIPPHEPLILFSDPTIEGIHNLFLNGTPSKYLCADEGGQVSGGHSMT
ncbi:MAG: DUF3987 domain-containing protein, partial [Bacteroidetes bacterium]|nr:DUF3987 domain-containing protein [Bacteroidota bacterium]